MTARQRKKLSKLYLIIPISENKVTEFDVTVKKDLRLEGMGRGKQK